MELQATVYGKIKKVDRDTMKEEVIKYYDATGIKHFYLDVEEMDDAELIALYENSFAHD
ncbi:hypothetical protein H6A03_00885 [[Clostridium] spiroforme]|nr:hypothetical protein [Thomasclavelia spiroformis]MBM6879903.1 hypothetical protein [Thomasclavelia spiroformis]